MVFPDALHLRCFNHFKANIKDKLKDLRFEMHATNAIVTDIMGCTSCGVRELGLVDVENEDDFVAKLNYLEDR